MNINTPLKKQVIYAPFPEIDVYQSTADFWGYRGQLERVLETMQCLQPLFSQKGIHKPILGIEVEIEDVVPKTFPELPVEWNSHNDGSLRNGVEYVSYPIELSSLPYAIINLYHWLAQDKIRKPSFSWRTSIHIHINVRELSLAQIANLFLLYAIFELLFFELSDPIRKNNIFCVPLISSGMDGSIRNLIHPEDSFFLKYTMSNWHKYSALNINRILDYGSIEFRHMSGIWDYKKLWVWANLIAKLFDAAQYLGRDVIVENIHNLNTLSKYEQFKRLVFEEPLSDYLNQADLTNKMISKGVTFAKKCIVEQSEPNYLIKPASQMDQFIGYLVKKQDGLIKKYGEGRPVKKDKLIFDTHLDSVLNVLTYPDNPPPAPTAAPPQLIQQPAPMNNQQGFASPIFAPQYFIWGNEPPLPTTDEGQ